MKKPRPRKAPMGPNLARLLADQPQLPRLRRRQHGWWATEKEECLVRWLSTHWVLSIFNPLANRRFRLRTSDPFRLERWLNDYFSAPQHPA
jgi:hypothetical protein